MRQLISEAIDAMHLQENQLHFGANSLIKSNKIAEMPPPSLYNQESFPSTVSPTYHEKRG